jgi:hypothetical protein
MESARKRADILKWGGLAAGLAVAHFFVLSFVAIAFMPGVTSGLVRPPYRPPWLFYAFMDVFGFPATTIFRIWRPGSADGGFAMSILIPTCLLWGYVWAEPFRRSCGWQPWRFSTGDLLVVTTIIAAILGVTALLNR